LCDPRLDVLDRAELLALDSLGKVGVTFDQFPEDEIDRARALCLAAVVAANTQQLVARAQVLDEPIPAAKLPQAAAAVLAIMVRDYRPELAKYLTASGPRPRPATDPLTPAAPAKGRVVVFQGGQVHRRVR
jgi:hypothetical protein